MPVMVKDTGGQFKLCPQGLQHAVCCDVVELGKVKTTYNGEEREREMVKLVWQTADEDDETGKPYIVQRRYTLSLNEKASLRKDLESWRGRAFTPEELKGFDLEKLLGVNCQLNVIHESRDNKNYANVSTIVPLSKGMSPIQPHDYIREKDRPKDAKQQNSQGLHDDDVPF